MTIALDSRAMRLSLSGLVAATAWGCVELDADLPFKPDAVVQDAGADGLADVPPDGEPSPDAQPFPDMAQPPGCRPQQMGTYIDDTGALAECDADGDGWTSLAARPAIEEGRRDTCCLLRTIDRFILQNELEQRLTVYVCDDGGELAYSTRGCDGARWVLPLYEQPSTDHPAAPAGEQRGWLGYVERTDDGSGRGRSLTGAERNPLTKACTHPNADANANGVDDLIEAGDSPVAAMPADIAAFVRFGHFVELHRSWFEAGPAGEPGAYVIAERSRCDDEPPVGQGEPPADGVPSPSDLALRMTEDGYWRTCHRNRDDAFDASAPHGHDLAEWSCDAPAGSCPTSAPPIAREGSDTAPPHGVCDLRGSVAERPWRGMTHHSQFKCVLVADDAGASPEPHIISRDDLREDGPYLANACFVPCPVDDPQCIRDCGGGPCATTSIGAPDGRGPQPRTPSLLCQPGSADAIRDSAVVFAVARFSPGQPYTRGCIDEWSPGTRADIDVSEEDDPALAAEQLSRAAEPWRALCPGYCACEGEACADCRRERAGVWGRGDPGDFGRLMCGCGPRYGGRACEQACVYAQPQMFTDEDAPDVRASDGLCDASGACIAIPDALSGSRRGFWLCGEPVMTVSRPAQPPYQFSARWRVNGQSRIGRRPGDARFDVEGRWVLR